MRQEIEMFITEVLGRTFTVFVILPVSLIVFAGLIVLQVFLSRKSNKLLGLIIPVTLTGVSIIISIIAFTVFAKTANKSETVLTGINLSAVMWMIINLLIINVPTITMYGIYAVCRLKPFSKLNKLRTTSLKKGLNKMNIEDL